MSAADPNSVAPGSVPGAASGPTAAANDGFLDVGTLAPVAARLAEIAGELGLSALASMIVDDTAR
ncbi:MAG: hypothetical protein JNK45_10880, partial [Myxococcales bacterium]|nr:hypothetical protein [Myxococcales bacterium]